MGNSKFVLASLILFFSFSAYGQEIGLKDKEIGISVFTLGANSETMNNEFESKYVFGVFYNQYFSNLSWISSVNYGNNTIDDDCSGCADAYTGKGDLTEFEITSGIRYTFLRGKRFFIKPFLESDLGYSNIIYKGAFGGGFTGMGTIIDYSYNTFGISGRAGLLFQPIPQVSLTISSSMRSGTGRRIDRSDDSDIKIKSSAVTRLEIRLGYDF